MKTKLMMLVAVAAISFGAQADWLYFLVSSYSSEGSVYNFDYARVGVAQKKTVDDNVVWTTGVGYLSATDSEAILFESRTAGDGPYVETGEVKVDVNNQHYDYRSDDYAFYIETWNKGGVEPIWGYDEATALSYNALKAMGHIQELDADGQMAGNTASPWAVPEPTSGMLLLLGFAALSLRRKQQKVGPKVEVEG